GALVDRALRPAPDAFAHAAVELVFRTEALGHASSRLGGRFRRFGGAAPRRRRTIVGRFAKSTVASFGLSLGKTSISRSAQSWIALVGARLVTVQQCLGAGPDMFDGPPELEQDFMDGRWGASDEQDNRPC